MTSELLRICWLDGENVSLNFGLSADGFPLPQHLDNPVSATSSSQQPHPSHRNGTARLLNPGSETVHGSLRRFGPGRFTCHPTLYFSRKQIRKQTPTANDGNASRCHWPPPVYAIPATGATTNTTDIAGVVSLPIWPVAGAQETTLFGQARGTDCCYYAQSVRVYAIRRFDGGAGSSLSSRSSSRTSRTSAGNRRFRNGSSHPPPTKRQRRGRLGQQKGVSQINRSRRIERFLEQLLLFRNASSPHCQFLWRLFQWQNGGGSFDGFPDRTNRRSSLFQQNSSSRDANTVFADAYRSCSTVEDLQQAALCRSRCCGVPWRVLAQLGLIPTESADRQRFLSTLFEQMGIGSFETKQQRNRRRRRNASAAGKQGVSPASSPSVAWCPTANSMLMEDVIDLLFPPIDHASWMANLTNTAAQLALRFHQHSAAIQQAVENEQEQWKGESSHNLYRWNERVVPVFMIPWILFQPRYLARSTDNSNKAWFMCIHLAHGMQTLSGSDAMATNDRLDAWHDERLLDFVLKQVIPLSAGQELLASQLLERMQVLESNLLRMAKITRTLQSNASADRDPPTLSDSQDRGSGQEQDTLVPPQEQQEQQQEDQLETEVS